MMYIYDTYLLLDTFFDGHLDKLYAYVRNEFLQGCNRNFFGTLVHIIFFYCSDVQYSPSLIFL